MPAVTQRCCEDRQHNYQYEFHFSAALVFTQLKILYPGRYCGDSMALILKINWLLDHFNKHPAVNAIV